MNFAPKQSLVVSAIILIKYLFITEYLMEGSSPEINKKYISNKRLFIEGFSILYFETNVSENIWGTFSTGFKGSIKEVY